MEAETRYGQGNVAYLGRGNYVQHGAGGPQVVPQGEWKRGVITGLAVALGGSSLMRSVSLRSTGQQQAYGSI